MVDAALAYARHGIPVLPVHTPAPGGGCSCGRGSCARPGKHPRLRHGLTEASTDPHDIERWWARWPAANVGLTTGVVMDVADVDSAEGWHGLRHLLGGELPHGPQVRTGGGGWHFWFRPLGHGNRVRVVPGLDWRGAGGYVIAPPSRHASGTSYYWVVRPGAGRPVVPPALAEMITGPSFPPAPLPALPTRARHPLAYAAAALAAETERVARAPVGARNDTLNRAAFALGRLVGAELVDAATAVRELTAAAAWAGLGRAETERTVRSGLEAGRRAGLPDGPRRRPADRRLSTPNTAAGERRQTTRAQLREPIERRATPGEPWPTPDEPWPTPGEPWPIPGERGPTASPGLRGPGDRTSPPWPEGHSSGHPQRAGCSEPRGAGALRPEMPTEKGRDRVA